MSLKNVLYFLTGVIVGAAGGVLAVKKYYLAVSEKEVAEVVEYYDKTYRKKDASIGKTVASEKTMKMVEKANAEAEKKLVEEVKEVTAPRTNYTDIFDKVKSGDMVVEDDMPEEDEHRDPYMITDEEYAAVLPPYDKVEAVYNKSEHCLVDKATEEELEIDKAIGFVVYDMIEERIRNGAYIYVRNDQFGVDYEIEVKEED